MTCFMQGINISTPSSPNLFSPGHFLARKFSKPMDLVILARSRRFSSLSSCRAPGVSSFCLLEKMVQFEKPGPCLLPDPLNLVEVVDVEILGSDTPAVDILQPAEDLLQ